MNFSELGLSKADEAFVKAALRTSKKQLSEKQRAEYSKTIVAIERQEARLFRTLNSIQKLKKKAKRFERLPKQKESPPSAG